ncbi:acyl-CoA dehydrogenase family protein [Spirosoma linguale]|uniref:Acyl-CoA dehydrogenase type 2 domain protein n=1 Tax=Spirosoma linguale (strain ATCC 33905 / DSM 74 / LMG 10896 / Claus 1) TaxID=504472 RepID=D2QKA9_SPILD|nr:Acyl-CoA dehydrogenase type 2 domain protein [Spirosoma linguale DSM 74]
MEGPTTTLVIDSIPKPPTRIDSSQLTELLARIYAVAGETDDEKKFPEKAFQWLANAGLLAVTLPGHQLDQQLPRTTGLLQLLKRIGAANLSVGRVYEGHINALSLIQHYAKPMQKKTWFADVNQHNRLFSVWNTQANDGVKIHFIGNGRYRLEGSKTFCSGAGCIQRPLVTGQLVGAPKEGWQMCIIPTERVSEIPQDDRFWQPLGMRASISYKLDFTGVELDEEDLLGQPDDYYRQPYFSGGAIRFAAVQLGGAEALFDATRSFLASMGRTDDAFQRMRLAEMACLIESGNQWLNTAGMKADEWLSNGTNADKLVAYANMTRTSIEEICLRMMPLAERSVGARGLMRPLPFERIHRDLTFYLRQPAPDATLIDIGRFVIDNQVNAHELWD